MCESIDPRVWRGSLGLMGLVLTASLVLIIALGLGWNSPRPSGVPDWESPGLPRVLSAASSATTALLLDRFSADVIFEVEAVPVRGPEFNGYGLIYRAQDAAHYYTFAVGADGYYAVLQVAGDEEMPLVDWQQFPHIRRGQKANRLRVACSGSVCRFTLNDEYVVTVDDDTWLTGDVGLWVRGYVDAGAYVQFRSARTWTRD